MGDLSSVATCVIPTVYAYKEQAISMTAYKRKLNNALSRHLEFLKSNYFITRRLNQAKNDFAV